MMAGHGCAPGYRFPDFRFCIVAVFLYVFSLSRFTDFPFSGSFSVHSPVYTFFTYVWVHKSWVHLILNALAFAVITKSLSHRIRAREYLPLGYLMAVLAACITVDIRPVCGSSGWVCALWGMNFYFVWQYRKENSYSFFAALSGTVPTLLLGFFHPAIHGMLHLVAFILGFAYAFFRYRGKLFLFVLLLPLFCVSCSARRNAEKTGRKTEVVKTCDSVKEMRQVFSDISEYVLVEEEVWERPAGNDSKADTSEAGLWLKKKNVLRVVMQSAGKSESRNAAVSRQTACKDSTYVSKSEEKKIDRVFTGWQRILWVLLLLLAVIGYIVKKVR